MKKVAIHADTTFNVKRHRCFVIGSLEPEKFKLQVNNIDRDGCYVGIENYPGVCCEGSHILMHTFGTLMIYHVGRHSTCLLARVILRT